MGSMCVCAQEILLVDLESQTLWNDMQLMTGIF